MNIPKRRFQAKLRAGTSVVEFAVCAPVLVVVFLGAVEISNSIFLKQAATAACYEAARVASGSSGTMARANTRGEEVLAARSIQGATFSYTPSLEADWVRGTSVEVSVTLPTSNLGVTRMFVYRNIQASLTMVKQ